MTRERVRRKISAILGGDVVGHSRLLSQDRVSTIEALHTHREMFVELVRQYDYQVLDAPGDDTLAGVESVSDAVNRAVGTKREPAERNAEASSAPMMQRRMSGYQ